MSTSQTDGVGSPVELAQTPILGKARDWTEVVERIAELEVLLGEADGSDTYHLKLELARLESALRAMDIS